jgi:hypothetical protein
MQSGKQGLNLISTPAFFPSGNRKRHATDIELDHNDKLTFSVILNAAFSLKVSKA